jgi:hypothetical protein
MKSKPHAELRARIRNVLWMALVLLFIGLIWRGFEAWLAMIESGYVPGNPVDPGDLIGMAATYLLENWQTEFFPLLGQMFGLACLLRIAPLQSESGKPSCPPDGGSSLHLDEGVTPGAEITN